MKNIFGPTGLLATRISGYEFRPGQLAMAEAIADVLTHGDEDDVSTCSSLVVEAETGLGKTLAYLIPAALNKGRVVVSTNTRNLQDQILQREIPLIQQIIAPELKALCIKGRQNYLCLYRWRQLQSSPQGELFAEKDRTALEHWTRLSTHGDRSELDWLTASSPLWQRVCCQSHFCLGGSCPEAEGCFLNRLRRDAGASRLLIVNHHLLFSDLAIRQRGFGEVLPRYETVIFDEAHHVEKVATTFFGLSVSRFQLLDLAGDVERGLSAEATASDQILSAVQRLNGANERFVAAFPAARGRFLLDEITRHQPEFFAIRNDLGGALLHLANVLDALDDGQGPWRQYADRALELEANLNQILAERFDDLAATEQQHIHWVERTERNLTLSASPIDIAEELRQTLFASVRRCVFTSATLTTGGAFTYFLDRIGLPNDTPTLSLPSPFDYPHRTRLFVPPSDFPEPSHPAYQQAVHASMETLIHHAGGRTLALFTSFQAMEAAYHALLGRLQYPMLLQGEAPRRTLLDQFSRETESVLFAVASFWEGVDVPGESLSLVVMDKIPFEVPTDPVIMARINRIKSLGGNPFTDFQVPRAILTLRQGAGRLMRSATDRGVIAILDPRLFSKGYGRHFRNSLPPCPIIRELDEVAAFFACNDETV